MEFEFCKFISAVVDSDDEDAATPAEGAITPAGLASPTPAAPEPAKAAKPTIASFFMPRKSAASQAKRPKASTAASGGKATDSTFKSDASSPPSSASAAGEGSTWTSEATSIRKGFYHPIEDVASLWTIGEPVPYAALCGVLKKVEGISSRLEMQSVRVILRVVRWLKSLCVLDRGDFVG